MTPVTTPPAESFGLDPAKTETLIRKLRNLPPELVADLLKGNAK